MNASLFSSIAKARPALRDRALAAHALPSPVLVLALARDPPRASTSHVQLACTGYGAVRIARAGARGFASASGEQAAVDSEQRDDESDEFSQLLVELESDDALKEPGEPIVPVVQPRSPIKSVPIPPPKPERPVIKLSTSTLLKPSFPAGPPTNVDLAALRPRRVAVPTIDTPLSRRILYQRTWQMAQKNVDRAFNKAQLRVLIGPKKKGGLEFDFLDPRWRNSIKTKEAKKKFWKPKQIASMTKTELVRSILILHWDMPDPETIPAPSSGPSVTEFIHLSNRKTFLLLSPGSEVVQRLAKNHGVKLGFQKAPETSALVLSVSGPKAAVKAVREEVENVEETCVQRRFELPSPAASLRAEVFQTISRMSKSFLEPGDSPNVVLASATQNRYLSRTERFLQLAFIQDAIQRHTPVFASVSASSLDYIKYTMFPFTPLVTPPWTSGSTNFYTRVKNISLAPVTDSVDSLAEHSAALEYEEYASKINRPDTLHLPAFSTVKPPSPLALLRAPLRDSTGSVPVLSATFGHVVWPLYVPAGPPGASAMGPTLDGNWTLPKFTTWRDQQLRTTGHKSVFLPAPPSGFLASTGVLTPLPSYATPFASLLGPTPTPVISEGPLIENVQFRRIVYRPVDTTDAGKGIESIEIEASDDSSVITTKVVESLVNVMVPNGACDIQYTLTSRETISEEEFKPFTSLQLRVVPVYITHDSCLYVLDTDRTINQTTIVPRAVSPYLVPALVGIPPNSLTKIQERWTDRTALSARSPGARGTSVRVILGEGVDDAASWSQVSETVEKMAKVPFPTMAESAVTQRVFKPNRGRPID